jgi:predicted hydrolase (HD superfamily)
MRAYARKFGEDQNLWGNVGLLHDFDYEKWPSAQDHPFRGSEILKERGYDEAFRRAILSHAEYSGVTRESKLEKTLFACDELAGFLTAVSYVKPGRSIHEVEVRGVRKKMKDKAFARAINREEITQGAAEMGVDLDAHIDFCIKAMAARAAELGVEGTPQAPPQG